jgi:hypothetical protein
MKCLKEQDIMVLHHVKVRWGPSLCYWLWKWQDLFPRGRGDSSPPCILKACVGSVSRVHQSHCFPRNFAVNTYRESHGQPDEMGVWGRALEGCWGADRSWEELIQQNRMTGLREGKEVMFDVLWVRNRGQIPFPVLLNAEVVRKILSDNKYCTYWGNTEVNKYWSVKKNLEHLLPVTCISLTEYFFKGGFYE